MMTVDTHCFHLARDNCCNPPAMANRRPARIYCSAVWCVDHACTSKDNPAGPVYRRRTCSISCNHFRAPDWSSCSTNVFLGMGILWECDRNVYCPKRIDPGQDFRLPRSQCTLPRRRWRLRVFLYRIKITGMLFTPRDRTVIWFGLFLQNGGVWVIHTNVTIFYPNRSYCGNLYQEILALTLHRLLHRNPNLKRRKRIRPFY